MVHGMSREERLVRALAAAAITFFLGWLTWAPGKALPSACGWHTLTGLPCGFCGGTRALRCAVAGDWRQAWSWNPLAVPAAAAGLAAAGFLFMEAAAGRRLLPRRAASLLPFLGASILAGTVAWSAYRAWYAFHTDSPLVNVRHPVVRFLQAHQVPP